MLKEVENHLCGLRTVLDAYPILCSRLIVVIEKKKPTEVLHDAYPLTTLNVWPYRADTETAYRYPGAGVPCPQTLTVTLWDWVYYVFQGTYFRVLLGSFVPFRHQPLYG